MSDNVIEVQNLTKRYGSTTVIKGISFSVARGEIFGLLGPNGSGKTTTILMLMGLTDISAGQVRVLAHDPEREPLAVKRRVGYLPDAVGFYNDLTAADNLRYTARLNRLDPTARERRIKSSLAHVGLADVINKRVGTFSHGMRQRLGLAEILMKDVQIAILDEPTSGLDPQATAKLLNIIRSLKQHDVSVLLSSHDLERVQKSATVSRCSMKARSRSSAPCRNLADKCWVVDIPSMLKLMGRVEGKFGKVPGVNTVEQTAPNSWRLVADGDMRPEAAAAVFAAGGRLFHLAVNEPSLEVIYTRYFASQEEPHHQQCDIGSMTD